MSITYYFTQPNLLAPQTKARSVDINTLSSAVRSAFEKIPAADQDWSGVHDFTAGKVRVPIPVGVNDAVNKGYVDTLLMSGQGKFSPPPVQGRYTFQGIDGVVSWEKTDLLQNPRKMAQAIALQFALS